MTENVPVYVLEFLLGQYCSSDDDTIIEQGVQNVKRILADNFVRTDESQKILAKLRLLKTSSLFDPFPPEMGTGTAFLDRMHCYLPV